MSSKKTKRAATGAQESSVDGPWSAIAERIGRAHKRWAAFDASLRDCFLVAERSTAAIPDPFALLVLCAELRADMNVLGQVGDDILRQVEEWADREAQESMNGLDEAIRRACGEHDVKIGGRFPTYVLNDFLMVSIHVSDRSCEIDKKALRTLLFERVWQEIAAALNEERDRHSEVHVFLERCYAAYLRATAIRHAPGSALPIRLLLRELVFEMQGNRFWRAPTRQNFSEYSEVFFRRDLARLVAEGKFQTNDGAKMELTPTAFAKDGIPLYVEGGIRYIGHIAFGGEQS